MPLDDQRVARQLRGFRVGDRKAPPVLDRHIDRGDRRSCRAVGENHFVFLAAALLAQDRGSAGGDIRFVQIEFVGIHCPLNDGLAQAVGGGDEHHLIESGFGVDGKHDAGGAEIAAHHALDPDGERDVRVGEPLMDPVGDGAVVVKGCEYLLYRLKNIL